MLCEKCGKNQATIFMQKKVNGIVEDYYICSSCANKSENNEKLGIFKKSDDEKVCKCNTSLQDIKESGFVGCENCYKTFKKELEPMISSLHGHLQHTGKRPMTKAETLKEQIKKANENKFFNLAKKLQAELDKINGEK